LAEANAQRQSVLFSDLLARLIEAGSPCRRKLGGAVTSSIRARVPLNARSIPMGGVLGRGLRRQCTSSTIPMPTSPLFGRDAANAHDITRPSNADRAGATYVFDRATTTTVVGRALTQGCRLVTRSNETAADRH